MYWCNKCGAVVSIGGKRDIVPCCKCGSENYTGSPQNLPKADVYSLLSDVRALKETIEAYKECFEKYIPSDKWDEATIFLSTYGSGLAKDILRKES